VTGDPAPDGAIEGRSSRRLRVYLSITELTRQIPDGALVGAPPVFVAPGHARTFEGIIIRVIAAR